MPAQPAPDVVRRNITVGRFRQLDPAGRQAPAPDWPLPSDLPGELDLWAKLWAYPQAVLWAEQHSEHIVARYVRIATAAAQPDVVAAVAAEARQLEDKLLLNMASLRKSYCEIGQAEAPPEPAPVKPKRRRHHLTVAPATPGT